MSETVNSNEASSQSSVEPVAETAPTEQVNATSVAADAPLTEAPAVSEADTPVQTTEAAPRSRAAVAQEIGNALAAARQQQGISLEDISSRLKVSIPKLQAIEAGAIDSLPDFTFAKGVMRSYAKTLRVPMDGLLDQLRQHEPQLTVGLKDEAGLGETYNPTPLLASVDKKLMLRVLSGVVLAGLAYAVFSTLQSMSANKTASPVVASAASQVVAPVAASSVASGAEAGMTQTALPAIAPLPSSAASAAAVAPTVAPTPASAAAPAPAVASTVTTSSVSGQGDAALRVRFAKDSWFEVRDKSGKSILAVTAKSGSEQIVKGTPPLKVMIGNVSGVETIEYQGGKVDLQTFAKSNVARLSLPSAEQ